MSNDSSPEISFPILDEPDREPDISEGVDYIVLCPRCEQYRHKSWMHTGWPACAYCMQVEKLFLDNLTLELAMRDPMGVMPQFQPGPDLSVADMKLKPLRPDRPVKKRRR